MTEQFNTQLTRVNETFLPLIERQLDGNGIQMDGYAKQCVLAAISGIHTVLDGKGISWNDDQLDKSSVTQALISIACLKLNAAAHPREVYFQIRNVKVKVDGKDAWKKQIEMGIEGDGNDAILARFGRDVKKVGQFWLVRDGDKFEYPSYNGLELQPPKWTPAGQSNTVLRVVYPVIKKDDTIEFYISERADVVRNLMAHINNNLRNETFGICKDRFSASSQQLKEIDGKKAALLKRAHDLGLAALDDEELQGCISPAWTEYHSRESMIIRKMRNNAVKRIPKDFGNAYIEMTYAEQDETESAMRREIAANANAEPIDVEPVEKTEEAATGAEPGDTTEATEAPAGGEATGTSQTSTEQAAPQQVRLDGTDPEPKKEPATTGATRSKPTFLK